MIEVIVKHKDSAEISEIVRTLKSQCLIIHKDFDFEYSPGKWDAMVGEIPRQTKFIFYNEKIASMFILKYL